MVPRIVLADVLSLHSIDEHQLETVDGDDVCCAGFHKGLWHLGASATMGAQNELDEQRCLYLGSLKYPYNVVGYARTG